MYTLINLNSHYNHMFLLNVTMQYFTLISMVIFCNSIIVHRRLLTTRCFETTRSVRFTWVRVCSLNHIQTILRDPFLHSRQCSNYASLCTGITLMYAEFGMFTPV